MAILAQFSVTAKDTKKLADAQKEANREKSFYYKPDGSDTKLLCGNCRSKENQNLRAKCDWKTGECRDYNTDSRCIPGNDDVIYDSFYDSLFRMDFL